LNAPGSGLGDGDEPSVESARPARFDTGFAGQRIASSVVFPGGKKPCRPFRPITIPAETNLWLNDRLVCFLRESLLPPVLLGVDFSRFQLMVFRAGLVCYSRQFRLWGREVCGRGADSLPGDRQFRIFQNSEARKVFR
jgi:hypothetical protein